MHRPTFRASLAALALATPIACGQNARPPSPAEPFYDPAPWMASLRPATRTDITRAARIDRLDRLPRYELALSYEASTRVYTLREELWFTNTERAPMSDLALRIYGNASRPTQGPGAHTAPPVRFVRGGCEGDACTVRQEAPSVLTVRPRAPIAPGGRLRVTIELQGTLPEIDSSRTNILAQGMESLSMLGAGDSGGDYGVLSTGEGIVSLANFYAVLARRVSGRWERNDHGSVGDLGSDELSNVHATVDAPAAWVVASTGVTINTSATGARRRTEIGAVGVRDFCVMMGQALQIETRRVGEVEVRSFFLPADRASGERVLDAAAGALQDFERRFGPYPYADLDVVEAPLVGGAGGVEFPGLVTVASMFYHQPELTGLTGGILSMLGAGDQITQSMSQMLPAMLEFVTAHEVAHQYWHGLVGSDSRLHPFIDESLAQWSATMYLEDRYGAERARRDGDLNVRMNYQFMRQLGQADGAVDRPASSFDSPMRYAGIVYGKGPYLYNALREAAGDAVYFRALRRYVDTWRFRTAPSTGFVDALIAEAPAQSTRFRALAHRWLEETHGDDDMGQADMGALLGGMLGNGAVSPDMQQAIEMLGPMLQGLQRQGAQGAPGRAPRGNGGSGARPQQGGSDVDPDVQRILQEMLGQ